MDFNGNFEKDLEENSEIHTVILDLNLDGKNGLELIPEFRKIHSDISIIVFPLYLDSLLTIAVTACCGLVSGLLCAVFSNILLTVFSGASIWFVICHLLTALIAWYVFHLYKRKVTIHHKKLTKKLTLPTV